MNCLKKWGSCLLSFISGILALSLSACSGMITTTTIMNEKTTDITKAFKVLTDSELLTQAKEVGLKSEFLTMKVFSIVLSVLSVILLTYSLVVSLKNVNVIKCESKLFSIIGLVLIVLFLVATIGVFISSLTYASAMTEKVNAMLALSPYASVSSATVKIGVYQPIMLATGIISTIVVAVCEIFNLKK